MTAARTRRRIRPLRGELTAPGDKSVSHRAVLLACMARGTSTIRRMNRGADVMATVDAARLFGAQTRSDESHALLEIESSGAGSLSEPGGVIDAGNSGTTLRTGLAVAAGIDGMSVFTGDASLRNRPMLRVVAPLRQMGAQIDGRSHGDRAPLVVRGAPLRGVDLELPVASAQVKTAVLLAGLQAEGVTEVTEPAHSRDHTERMLEAAGVRTERSGLSVAVTGGHLPEAREWQVPGDFSSAMFLVAAALLVDGSDLTIRDVGLNPTRTAALDVLLEMGADIEVGDRRVESGEPVGTLRARAGELRGFDLDPSRVPLLIDEIPILSVLATQARGITAITGAAELRVKESDRIAAMAANLSALGASVEERPDGMVIEGPTPLRGGLVDPRGDHRIALSFAVAGLVASEKVRVHGWSCVDTSFPEFLDLLGMAQA